MRKLYIIIVACLLLVMATPAYAINQLDSLTINAIYAYHHCIEEDDQLYLADFTADNSAPDNNIQEVLLFRLKDGDTELSAVAPYYFSLAPWGRQCIGIYFSADDAPTWNDDKIAEVIGNPTVSWNGTIPQETSAIIYSSSESIATTQNEISLRILILAQTLETAWEDDYGVDVIEDIAGGQALTSYGETYFNNIIENCQTLAPYAYASTVTIPDFEHRTADYTYSENLTAEATTNTPMDFTSLGIALGRLDPTVTTVAVFGVVVVALAAVWTTTTRSTKPLLLLLCPTTIAGVLAMGVPLILAVGLGLVMMIFAIYVITYEKASV